MNTCTHEPSMVIASGVIGAILAWAVTLLCVGDRQVELSQRELVKHGFAFYTNGPSGYPVFKMKDAK